MHHASWYINYYCWLSLLFPFPTMMVDYYPLLSIINLVGSYSPLLIMTLAIVGISPMMQSLSLLSTILDTPHHDRQSLEEQGFDRLKATWSSDDTRSCGAAQSCS